MMSEGKSDKRQSTPLPDAPEPSEASHSEKEQTHAQTTEGVEPEKAAKDKDLGDKDAIEPSPNPSDSGEDTDTSKPVSSPCTCRCGGCCCHTTQSDPHHCVRCHADYILNHPEACSVPHVFYKHDLDRNDADVSCRDMVVRSLCCGSNVCGAEPLKCDWDQPTTCFLGWHTTDVGTVEREVQYNGFNVLRCDPDPERGGKCRRKCLKFLDHGSYQHVFDDQVDYNQGDEEDRETHLERMRIINDGEYNMVFQFVDEAENIGKKRKRGNY